MAEEYIDLGLPSRTLWKKKNESEQYNFDDAIGQFGYNFPSEEQWKELHDECQWIWNGKGYTVFGPNGKHIVLPAEGYCHLVDSFCAYYMLVSPGACGNYWALATKDFEYAWAIDFDSDSVKMNGHFYSDKLSVRLVK